jgi:MFS family permease
MTVSDASAGPPVNGAPPSDRAFDYPGYRLYWVARFLLVFAIQVLSVSVGWQIYDQTRDPFLLGLVGLVQFLPAPLLVLVTGSVADRYNRRVIMAICMAVEGACALALLSILHSETTEIWPVFAVLLVFGIARAFMGPAVQSLLANLVPQQAFANAIALNSSSFQIATIVGPTAGGLLYGVSSELAYSVSVAFFLFAGILTLMIP